jgi:hypothetical protein
MRVLRVAPGAIFLPHQLRGMDGWQLGSRLYELIENSVPSSGFLSHLQRNVGDITVFAFPSSDKSIPIFKTRIPIFKENSHLQPDISRLGIR